MIDLIIDIPKKGNDIHSDGFKIRRTAIECDVSIMTSLDTVKALVDVMEHRYTPDTVEVISLSVLNNIQKAEILKISAFLMLCIIEVSPNRLLHTYCLFRKV